MNIWLTASGRAKLYAVMTVVGIIGLNVAVENRKKERASNQARATSSVSPARSDAASTQEATPPSAERKQEVPQETASALVKKVSVHDKKYMLLHASTGNGHKMVACALRDALQAKGIDAHNIVMKDLAEFGSMAKLVHNESYPYIIKHMPRLYEAAYSFADAPFCVPTVALFNAGIERELTEWIRQENPDVIISSQPITSFMCARAKQKGLVTAPLVSVVTDYCAHHVWVAEGVDYYWVAHQKTADSFIDRGVNPKNIRVGGMPIHGRFWENHASNRAALLKQWGLPNDRFVILMSNWVAGHKYTKKVLKSLEPYADKVACCVVCGHDKKARHDLEQRKYPFPTRIVGFVDQMDELMDMSDLLLSKAGGVTISESLAKRLPIAINKPLFGQERLNADFLEQHDAAFSMNKPEDIQEIMKQILADTSLLPKKRMALNQLVHQNPSEKFIDFLFEQVVH